MSARAFFGVARALLTAPLMFDIDEFKKSVPAWFEQSVIPGTTTDEAPDLRLHMLIEEENALAVEVAEGTVRSNAVLFLVGRGPYEVTATVRRQTGREERVFLRLRPARSCESREA